MMAWTGAGGDAQVPPVQPLRNQEGSSSEAQPSHQRHIYSVPGTALLTEPERNWAKFEVCCASLSCHDLGGGGRM